MTYAEKEHRPVFDWNTFLNKGEYTIEELHHAKILSNNWITCACGNQCDIIPRRSDGCPKDWELAMLGYRFNTTIEQLYDDYHYSDYSSIAYWLDNAKNTLYAIEKRSVQLIKEIQDENNTI